MWGWIIGKIGIKGIVVGLASVALTGIITLGYRHYTGLVDDKATLSAQVSTLEGELRTERARNSAFSTALARNEELREQQEQDLRVLAQEREAAQREARRLNGIFAEHDFTRLTLAKPGLIERRVNSGTARAGRLLECASGGACPDAE